jgi:hypothetical protein
MTNFCGICFQGTEVRGQATEVGSRNEDELFIDRINREVERS